MFVYTHTYTSIIHKDVYSQYIYIYVCAISSI